MFPTSADNEGKVAYAFTHTIAGQAVAGERFGEVVNPATGEAFAMAPLASSAQLEEAVASARSAFPSWSRLSFGERADRIRDFTAGLKERSEEIAHVITREQGKPLASSRAEMAMSAKFITDTLTLEVTSEMLRQTESHVISLHYRPIGVVAGITPLERSRHSGGIQDRAGALYRQHAGAQTLALYTAFDSSAGRGLA